MKDRDTHLINGFCTPARGSHVLRTPAGACAVGPQLTGVELVDLGDAMKETKQCYPDPAIWPDSWFGWGGQPWTGGGPPQC